MNTCEPFKELMSDYLDGVLDPAREPEFLNHMEACDDCRRLLGELRRTVGLVRELPQVVPPADLMEKIHARLEAARPRPKLRPWQWFALPQVRVAMAACLLVTFALFYQATRPAGVPATEEARGQSRGDNRPGGPARLGDLSGEALAKTEASERSQALPDGEMGERGARTRPAPPSLSPATQGRGGSSNHATDGSQDEAKDTDRIWAVSPIPGRASEPLFRSDAAPAPAESLSEGKAAPAPAAVPRPDRFAHAADDGEADNGRKMALADRRRMDKAQDAAAASPATEEAEEQGLEGEYGFRSPGARAQAVQKQEAKRDMTPAVLAMTLTVDGADRAAVLAAVERFRVEPPEAVAREKRKALAAELHPGQVAASKAAVGADSAETVSTGDLGAGQGKALPDAPDSNLFKTDAATEESITITIRRADYPELLRALGELGEIVLESEPAVERPSPVAATAPALDGLLTLHIRLAAL